MRGLPRAPAGACEADARLDTGRFILARLARIAPAYAVGLLILFPFFVYSYAVAGSIDLTTFLSACVLVPLMAQAWFDSTALVWNTPGWSLSVEWFFYAIYPALLALAMRASLAAFAGLAVGFLVAVEALREGLKIAGYPGVLGFIPLFYLPQFVCGIALARWFLSGRRLSPRVHDLVLLLGLLAVCVVMEMKPSHAWPSSNVVLVPLFGLVIFAAAGAAGPVSRVLSARPLILLGEASYALYILHWPFFMYWQRVWQRVLGVTLPPAVDFMLYFVAVILFSIAALFWIERPGRRWITALAGR